MFLFSALLFFIGYALAPTIYYKEINWLLKYPLWIIKWMDQLSKQKWKPIYLFIFLFIINAFSLFVDLISAFIPILPFIFAIWTGINIGVVTYHTLEGSFYYAALLNPVAFFELPAAFLTFCMAFQYNFSKMGISTISMVEWKDIAFEHYLFLFLIVVLPVLFIAGIIETYLIHFSNKFGNDSDEDI